MSGFSRSIFTPATPGNPRKRQQWRKHQDSPTALARKHEATLVKPSDHCAACGRVALFKGVDAHKRVTFACRLHKQHAVAAQENRTVAFDVAYGDRSQQGQRDSHRYRGVKEEK